MRWRAADNKACYFNCTKSPCAPVLVRRSHDRWIWTYQIAKSERNKKCQKERTAFAAKPRWKAQYTCSHPLLFICSAVNLLCITPLKLCVCGTWLWEASESASDAPFWASFTSSWSPHAVNWKQTVRGSFNLLTFPFRSMTEAQLKSCVFAVWWHACWVVNQRREKQSCLNRLLLLN